LPRQYHRAHPQLDLQARLCEKGAQQQSLRQSPRMVGSLLRRGWLLGGAEQSSLSMEGLITSTSTRRAFDHVCTHSLMARLDILWQQNTASPCARQNFRQLRQFDRVKCRISVVSIVTKQAGAMPSLPLQLDLGCGSILDSSMVLWALVHTEAFAHPCFSSVCTFVH